MVANNNSNRVMLTTIDNPYDPFTDFDRWYGYDMSKGYATCSYLARIANDTNDLPIDLEDLEREKAIDEIVELNVLGLYLKVTPESFKERQRNLSGSQQ